MTIYAIVNNLIDSDRANDSLPAIWTVVSAAGILQGGNPFFVPDFANRFQAHPALAVKIGKLGKGIAQRFAHRYVDSVAPCVIFVASDMLQHMREQGLPWSKAISYDKCMAIGKFVKLPFEDLKKTRIDLRIQSKGMESFDKWTLESADPGIDDVICQLSRDNTLKTGDMILVGIAASGEIVNQDMKISVSLNGEESLKFNIR